MKRKNTKKIWIVVIISLQFVLLCSAFTNNVNAWGNGNRTKSGPEIDVSVASGHVTEAGILTWRAEGAGVHYGTHDSIAEAALNAVLLDQYAQPWKVFSDEGQPGSELDFWDARRRTIYLIATEAPDFGPSQVSMTLNGQPVGGLANSVSHNIWFNPSTYPVAPFKVREGRVFPILTTQIENVRTALNAGKCDLAAWYMGCVSHLIADLSNWMHTISQKYVRLLWNPQFGYNIHTDFYPSWLSTPELSKQISIRHTAIEADITAYTSTSAFPIEPIITYPLGFRVSPTGIKDPRNTALELAFYSRFDVKTTAAAINAGVVIFPEGPLTAMDMFFQSWYIYSVPEQLRTKPLIQQSPAYQARVNALLGEAVKGVASMIDYFGSVWNATPRKCTGSKVDQKADQIVINREKLMGISMLMMMGVAMSFFSGIMLAQLKTAMKKDKNFKLEDLWATT